MYGLICVVIFAVALLLICKTKSKVRQEHAHAAAWSGMEAAYLVVSPSRSSFQRDQTEEERSYGHYQHCMLLHYLF